MVQIVIICNRVMSAHMIFVKLYDMHNFTQQLIVDICLSIRNYLKRLPLLGGRVCYICFLILLMPSNSFACDEDEQCIEQDTWSIGLAFGLGAKTNPLVDGDAIPQVLMLDIAWYGENAYFDNGEIGYRWLEDETFGLESYITLDRERAFFHFWDPANILLNTGVIAPSNDPDSEQDITVSIDDISDRKWAVLGGSRLSYYSGSQKLSLSLETDISGIHNGHRIGLSYQKTWAGDKWRVQLTPSLTWKSDAVVDYYYGLDRDDKALLLYDGKAGIQPGISLFYAYEITPKWHFLFNTSYQSLHSGMTNSPLVKDNSVSSVFIGAGYRF
jgi:outer membrane protein